MAAQELPSHYELFNDDIFETGNELKIMKKSKIPPLNEPAGDDELEKYLGKKFSGISSWTAATRKNSIVEEVVEHIQNDVKNDIGKENDDEFDALFNGNDDNDDDLTSKPNWKLIHMDEKNVYKTDYSKVAAKIREETILCKEQSKQLNVPVRDPRLEIFEDCDPCDQSDEVFDDDDFHLYLSEDDEDIELENGQTEDFVS